MNYPEELKYTKSHEWVKQEKETYYIGITDFAQDALGDIVFVNLPEVGDEVTVGEVFADVESVKAVSDIYSPVTGTVKEINEELIENPEKMNVDPYGAWMIVIECVSEKEECMNAAEYSDFISSQE